MLLRVGLFVRPRFDEIDQSVRPSENLESPRVRACITTIATGQPGIALRTRWAKRSRLIVQRGIR